MERLLPGIEAHPVERQVDLHFALAKAYRDTGRHEPSFRHLVQGNALKRRQINYDESNAIGLIDRIREVFTPELMRNKAEQGDPSSKPLFIIGMPRSGTTLIEQILASHPQVHGGGEREDFQNAVLALKQAQPYPATVPALSADQFGALGAAYVAALTAATPDADRVTDKMPANFLYAGLIYLALPNARIIHARRDPVDTCVSCFSTLFVKPLGYTFDLAELGRYYRAYEGLMTHWRQVMPGAVMLEVSYEDVVADIETQARRLVAHCGLAWDEACLAFHKSARPVHTASAAQVRQPIYRSAIGRWRPYRDQLQPLFEALGVTPD